MGARMPHAVGTYPNADSTENVSYSKYELAGAWLLGLLFIDYI